MLITPPGWGTDEPSHTYRVYQLSSGDIRSEKVIDDGYLTYGGQVPTNLVKFFDQTGVNAPNAPLEPTVKVNGLYSKNPNIRNIKDDGQRRLASFSGAALYSPITYAIYIPVFWIGKWLSLSFFWMVMISRLVGLLVTALAFFYAIKLTPIGKWIFFAVGLLPAVIAQAATVGADAPQLAASVLFVTGALRLILASSKPRLRHWALMALLGIILVLIKIVYAPMVLLLLAVPLIRKDSRDRRTWLLATAAVILAIVPGLIWLHLVSYIKVNSNLQANFAGQKHFIITHPLTYLNVLYQTLLTNSQAATANISGNFIWSSAPLPALHAYMSMAAMVCSLFAISGREKAISTNSRLRGLRFILLGISILAAILVATALYVYSTPLKASSVWGIQSRYFIPLLPMVLLLFWGNSAKNQRVIKIAIVVLSCLVLVGGLLTVYDRLYVTLPAILQ